MTIAENIENVFVQHCKNEVEEKTLKRTIESPLKMSNISKFDCSKSKKIKHNTEGKMSKRIIVSPVKMRCKSDFMSNNSQQMKHGGIYNSTYSNPIHSIEYVDADAIEIPHNDDQKLDVKTLSQIEKLPEEVLGLIFSFLNTQDICRCKLR